MENKILFVWDFHGVLEKDNEHSVHAICNQVFQEFGINQTVSIEKVIELYGLSWSNYYKHLVPDATEETIKQMHNRSVIISEGLSSRYTKPNDFAEHVLSTIQSQGHTNIVVSNTRPKRLIQFTNDVGLTSFFDEHLGVDRSLESGDFDIVKHKTNCVLGYLSNKHFSKIIKIGDKETDICVGKNVGATTYLFNKNGNVPTKADYTISDLRDVLKEIQGN